MNKKIKKIIKDTCAWTPNSAHLTHHYHITQQKTQQDATRTHTSGPQQSTTRYPPHVSLPQNPPAIITTACHEH